MVICEVATFHGNHYSAWLLLPPVAQEWQWSLLLCPLSHTVAGALGAKM